MRRNAMTSLFDAAFTEVAAASERVAIAVGAG